MPLSSQLALSFLQSSEKLGRGGGHCIECNEATGLHCIPNYPPPPHTHTLLWWSEETQHKFLPTIGRSWTGLCCWKWCSPPEVAGTAFRRQLWWCDVTAISSGMGGPADWGFAPGRASPQDSLWLESAFGTGWKHLFPCACVWVCVGGEFRKVSTQASLWSCMSSSLSYLDWFPRVITFSANDVLYSPCNTTPHAVDFELKSKMTRFQCRPPVIDAPFEGTLEGICQKDPTDFNGTWKVEAVSFSQITN